MFELLKIKFFIKQPVAVISNDTLARIIAHDYPDSIDEVKKKLVLITTGTLEGRNRLAAAVLKLSNADLSKIDYYVEMCNDDFRDVIAAAEYPRRSKLGFNKLPNDQLKELYTADWKEYSGWVNKH